MHRIGISVSTRLWAIAAVAAAFAAAPPSAWAIQPAADSAPRTVTVAGEGEVKAAPDEAILSAGVVSEAPNAADALAANSRAMNEIFSALKRQGVPQKSVQTTEFMVTPQFETAKDGSPTQHITGYQISNSLTVTVDDLSKLGATIDTLVAAGANSLGGISFTIRDSKPLLAEARDQAIKDATDRAEIYAKAAGISLGRVMMISEGEMQFARPEFQTVMVTAARMATPIAAGEQTVSARVMMTFEIK